MLHLIKLEMKRMKFSKIFTTALLINLGVLVFAILVNLDTAEENPEFRNYAEVLTFIKIFVGAAFVIYASVLLSRLFIDEFRKKTITILFMYPIDRKKLLLSKLVIVSALTFCFVILSYILVTIGFYILNRNLHFVTDPLDSLTMDIVASQALHLVVYAVSCAGMALIPLFFGMIKKSVPATIVSSIFIVVLLNSGDSGHTLASHIAVPIVLGIAGFLIAYSTIRKAVKTDL